MPRMSNAPLRYVLAMMRFPKILNIEKLIPEFQDQIRDEYPHLSENVTQGVQVSVGPNGTETKPTSDKLWQFASPDRGCAFILGGEFLVLHAGPAYQGHEDFIARFQQVVEASLRVKGLARHVTNLGYRYVDLVKPDAAKQQTLSTYLQPWVMPDEKTIQLPDLELKDSAAFMVFKTLQGMLRFQIFRRPPATLSPDLISPFVKENNWLLPRPDGEFALLDLDHGKKFADTPAIDAKQIAEHLRALRQPINDLFFKAAVTPAALTEWK